MTLRGYAVVTINQASRQPEDVEGVFFDFATAENVALSMRDDTAAVGRGEQHVVCELLEVGSDD